MALTDQLEGYWNLDESSGNAADSTANANTLTNNGTTPYVAAKINNGADFELASSQSLSRADSTSLSVTGNISIAGWIKVESDPAADTTYCIAGKWFSTGDQRSYFFGYDNNGGVKHLQFTYVSDGVANDTESSIGTTLTAGTFFHVAATVVVATKVVKFYVDGVETTGTNADANATAIFDSTADFALGKLGSNAAFFMDGILDEVGVWSRALTAAEITELYNGGAGLAYPFTSAAANHWLLMGV